MFITQLLDRHQVYYGFQFWQREIDSRLYDIPPSLIVFSGIIIATVTLVKACSINHNVKFRSQNQPNLDSLTHKRDTRRKIVQREKKFTYIYKVSASRQHEKGKFFCCEKKLLLFGLFNLISVYVEYFVLQLKLK